MPELLPKQASEAIQVFDVGLSFSGAVTFQEWERKGRELNKVVQIFTNHIRWWLGDWIIFGETMYPEKYSQALDEGNYKIGTLRNGVYVCRNVPLSSRNPNLSFEHHYEVAKVKDPEEQKKWLADADMNHWTIRQLRAAIAGNVVENEHEVPDKIEDAEPKWVWTFEDWWAKNEAELKLDPHKKACRTAWNNARLKV